MDADKKKKLAKFAKKYQNMKPGEKQKLLSDSAEKYQSMSPDKKQNIFQIMLKSTKA